MYLKLIFLTILMCVEFRINNAYATETVHVPSGKLDAFWNEPTENSNSQKASSSVVSVDAFVAMKNQVTHAEFQNFIKKNPQWSKTNASTLFVDETYLRPKKDSVSEREPITNISWFAARSYCEYLNMRLPTIAEWEYMAAASKTLKDANSSDEFLARILAWYSEPQGENLKPVGSIYKNLYGVWDLHGLVWEWVEDFNSQLVTGESREDISLNKDMYCGGGIIPKADRKNYAAFMRFAFRSSLKGRSSVWNLGFRCVRSL